MPRKARRRPITLEVLESRDLLAVIQVSPNGEKIQSALNRAQAGDMIELASGDYYQDVISVRNGREGAPITLHGPADAVLHGAGGARVFQVFHDYITLDGFTFDGLAGDPNKAESYRDKLLYAIGTSPQNGVEHLRVLNMTFRNSGGEALRLRYFAKHNEVAYSHFENTGIHDFRFGAGGKNGEAIYVGTSNNQWADGKNPTAEPDQSTDNWIHHNTFNTRGNEAVDIKEGAFNNLVEHNTVTGQLDTESGGLDSRGDSNTFRYNTVYGNKGAGIRLGGALVNGHQYGQGNNVYGNTIRDNANGGIKFMVSPQGNIAGNTMSGNVGGNAVGSFGDQFNPTAGQAPDPGPQPDPDPDPQPDPEPEPNPTPVGGVLTPASVSAQSDDGNAAANVLDGKLSTRWSAEGKGQWLNFDLGVVHLLEAVDIAFYQGTNREAYFDIEVSINGTNWTRILQGTSSGHTNALQHFDFADVAARYVRIVGRGNSQSLWNSLTEVNLLGGQSDPPPVPDPEAGPAPDLPPGENGVLAPLSVTAQSHDGNQPQNVLDGDLGSRWSAEGIGQWLQFDLGSAHTVDALDIAFYQGTRREAYFDVEVSTNGLNWTRVLQGTSSGHTDALQRFDFADVAARYVRIIGRGNSQSLWNSLTEVNLLGRGVAAAATAQTATTASSAATQSVSTISVAAPVQPRLAVSRARVAWEAVWSAQQTWVGPTVYLGRFQPKARS
jgi:parallel beta-helix repeat protein